MVIYGWKGHFIQDGSWTKCDTNINYVDKDLLSVASRMGKSKGSSILYITIQTQLGFRMTSKASSLREAYYMLRIADPFSHCQFEIW